MKKVLALTLALLFGLSTMVYAGGDKNCGDKGQGSTGDKGKGQTTQTRKPNP